MGQAVFVFGPAGSGKTTFAKSLLEHGRCNHRTFVLVNLDPAQVSNDIEYSIDIRDYITVKDVMDECDFGPNGGLMVALEELWDNIEELELDTYTDSYLVFDCPGQLELFMHSNTMKNIVEYVKRFYACGIFYLMESQYVMDLNKFIGGCLCSCISAGRFDLPILNILTKVDLIEEDRLQKFVPFDINNLEELSDKKYTRLTKKIFNFLEENGAINLIPLDLKNEDSIGLIMYKMDYCLQYYDDIEPIETKEG